MLKRVLTKVDGQVKDIKTGKVVPSVETLSSKLQLRTFAQETYLKNYNLSRICPMCGQVFTSMIRLQLHLMFYPKEFHNCNLTPETFVECDICKKQMLGKYFDMHPCIYEIVAALDELGLSDEPRAVTEAQDHCMLCNISVGCRYSLIAHLIVYHYPFAKKKQCGYCGLITAQLDKHFQFHRSEIMIFSIIKLKEILESARSIQKRESLTGLLGCCKINYYNVPRPTDLVIYLFQPNSCLVCTNFIGKQMELQDHYLWKWNKCSFVHLRRKVASLFIDRSDNCTCRFCKQKVINIEDHVCDSYNILIRAYKRSFPAAFFMPNRNCLLCWSRNHTFVSFMTHGSASHNISAILRCGICGKRTNYNHENIHHQTFSANIVDAAKKMKEPDSPDFISVTSSSISSDISAMLMQRKRVDEDAKM